MCAYVCTSCSVVSDSMTPWTVACQVPLSMEFSRQEYWGGCHSLLQGLLKPGSKPRCPALQADSLSPESPGKPKYTDMQYLSCFGKIMNIYEPISASIILLQKFHYVGLSYTLEHIIKLYFVQYRSFKNVCPFQKRYPFSQNVRAALNSQKASFSG